MKLNEHVSDNNNNNNNCSGNICYASVGYKYMYIDINRHTEK